MFTTTHTHIHNVTIARIERRENGTRWTVITLTGSDGSEQTITLFAPHNADVSIINDTDQPEDDEPRPIGRYEESVSYRADMINAGRGHLLGD